MKFFNIDLHVSVIADIKNIFEEMGHVVDVNYLSSASWVFNEDITDEFCIKNSNWMGLNQEMCDRFFEENREKLDGYDGFIVTHITALSLLYEKFNKPIIFVASSRYEFPFTFDTNKWNSFNNYVNNNKNIIPITNNLFDKWYSERFLSLEFTHIPSFCNYTNMNYNPTSDNHLLFSKVLKIKSEDLVDRYTLHKIDWKHLTTYKSIIHIPYNVSTMSIFEHYKSNIPLFFPDKDFLFKLSCSGYSLNELSYYQVYGGKPKSIVNYDGDTDPNNYTSTDLISKSIELSDFNNGDMKEIIHFSNIEDLQYKLKNIDLVDKSKKMELNNQERKEFIFNSWKKILDKL